MSVCTSPKRTVPSTAAIRATSLSGPVTLTSLGVTAASPARVPDGGSFANRGCTSSVREVRRSMRTETVGGETSITSTPSFATVTLTRASCASAEPSASACASNEACRSDSTTRSATPGAPRNVTPTSGSCPRST